MSTNFDRELYAEIHFPAAVKIGAPTPSPLPTSPSRNMLERDIYAALKMTSPVPDGEVDAINLALYDIYNNGWGYPIYPFRDAWCWSWNNKMMAKLLA